MLKVGIFGVTGYTGIELVQILERHPECEIVFGTSQSYAGQTLDMIFPMANPLPLVTSEEAPLADADVVFLCLPHAAAAGTAIRALEAGCYVVDLSADFRIKDVELYEAWYKTTHPAPELLEKAVYGLTEFARGQLPGAKLVATPGCYPTSVLLGIQPIIAHGWAADTIVADSKSGVSGAGRKPKQNTHFVEIADNFYPYAVGQKHRHWPEMLQTMELWNASSPGLVFTPHLLPVPRGILSTIYVPLTADAPDEEGIRSLYAETYANEPFVKVLPAGSQSTLTHATHTNRCVISLTMAGNMLIISSAIDNLIKGASGQAVQNMNVVFGYPETAGLIA